MTRPQTYQNPMKNCPVCGRVLTRYSQVLSGAAGRYAVSCPLCNLLAWGRSPEESVYQFSLVATERLMRPTDRERSRPLRPVLNDHQQYLAEQQRRSRTSARDEAVIREWNETVEAGLGEKHFVPLTSPPPKKPKKKKEKAVAQLDESALLPVVPWVLDPEEED
jgi:hypothetical protein